MTTQPIIESGMKFGPYPPGDCYYIEKSQCYTAVQDHVPIAEFLLLKYRNKKPIVWVVGAKSSSPCPETKPSFDDFIIEIREKWMNAFSLGWAAILNRHPLAADELPEKFKNLDLSKAEMKFILVINGHKEEWLQPLNDALSQAMRATIKTWGFSPASVAVMNHSLAQKYGLISSEEREMNDEDN